MFCFFGFGGGFLLLLLYSDFFRNFEKVYDLLQLDAAISQAMQLGLFSLGVLVNNIIWSSRGILLKANGHS